MLFEPCSHRFAVGSGMVGFSGLGFYRGAVLPTVCFSQLQLVTFCIMGNHWHLLVSLNTAEPNPLQDAPHDVFFDHLGLVYSETEFRWQLASFRAGGFEEAAVKGAAPATK